MLDKFSGRLTDLILESRCERKHLRLLRGSERMGNIIIPYGSKILCSLLLRRASIKNIRVL